MCVLCLLSLRSTQVSCHLSFRSSVFRLQCLPACAGLPRPPPSAYMRLHWAACGVEERGGAGGAAQPAGAKESSASTGAATEVGAGLSAKDRRTYWEPCAKGNEARREWAPAFEAMVKGNEQEAADYWDRQSKKEKDRQRWRRLGESKIFSTIDLMHQQLLRYRELELRVEIPPALFKCGQSVLQWWAPWMKDAEETPASYNKKNRPWWFSAEVTSYRGYGDIKYAGQVTRDHQYNVY